MTNTTIIRDNIPIIKNVLRTRNQAILDEIQSNISPQEISTVQKRIIDAWRAEERYSAVKFFECSNLGRTPAEAVQELLNAGQSLQQNFLTINAKDSYSTFLHTDGDNRLKISFAGYTNYEKEIVDDFNQYEVVTYTHFNVFELNIFTSMNGRKVFAYVKFPNRRRYVDRMNFFDKEVEYIRDWLRKRFKCRLKGIDVRDFFANHTFSPDLFEMSGFNVSDIAEGREEILPIDLKFRSNKNAIRPQEVYNEVNKHVKPELSEAFKSMLLDLGEDEEKAVDISDKLKRLNLSLYFFESAFKAFSTGVGYVKYKKDVAGCDDGVVFRFDFPLDQQGVVKLDRNLSGKHMRYIYAEIETYINSI